VTAEQIKNLANELVERLRDDISTANNREHHIRASARANEAHLLLEGINQMFDTSSTEDDDNDLQEEV
jgi:hypothetical protein